MEVIPDFREDDLRGWGTDAIDARQIDARESPESRPSVLLSTSPDRLFFARVRMSRNGLLRAAWRMKRLDLLKKPRIIGGDLGLHHVE